jgi:NADPH-dependent 2,4-dienoyl-CoA reductase/sulfur reductase-like enzyme
MRGESVASVLHLFVFSWLLRTTVVSAAEYGDFINTRYVVIGGGPAGLQMAHYLQSSGRTYVVLERSDTVGAFFTK